MPKISAIINVYNEERQIRQCLETIKWVDEIIVADSCSNDKTIEICKEYTDKIYRRKYQRYARTRNWLLQFASFEWILSVDADERFTARLAGEIRERTEKEKDIDGYYIPFINFCFGKKMKYWRRGEKHPRLFKNKSGRWEEKEVHPKLIVRGKLTDLTNPILHYPYPNLKVYFEKFNRYIRWEVDEMGKHYRNLTTYDFIKSILSSPFNFYRIYISKKAFIDGWRGLFFSFFHSIYYPLYNSIYYFSK